MKNRFITGIGAIILGLLISLGPKTIFELCEVEAGGSWPDCHWTGQAELGIGLLIAILGVLLLIFPSKGTRLGLSIAISLTGILVLLYPTVLIGGCTMKNMVCWRVAFPSLIIIGIITVIGFAFNSLFLFLAARDPKEEKD